MSMLKKSITIICTLFLLMFILVSCQPKEEPIEYSETPSNWVIRNYNKTYYASFDYKGKRYKINLNQFEWIGLKEYEHDIYADIYNFYDTENDCYVKKLYFGPRTETTNILEMEVSFPESDEEYFMLFVAEFHPYDVLDVEYKSLDEIYG